ncbi:MAG: hypothetical protein V4584_04745 [Verrucomicrobiota bacterium]
MTGIIDDIAPILGALLVASGLASRFLGHRFPALTRFRSAVVVLAATSISILFLAFIITAASSAPPGLERFDILTHSSVRTWYCLSAVLLTFLPIQLLWLPRLRTLPLAVIGAGMMTLLPSALAILCFRSSAEPFYFASVSCSSADPHAIAAHWNHQGEQRRSRKTGGASCFSYLFHANYNIHRALNAQGRPSGASAWAF